MKTKKSIKIIPFINKILSKFYYMEKIVYLFFIVIGFYFIYNYCQKQTAETFENITLGSADDQNSINKLAQIANQLMTGGVTVPGNMNIQGEVNWSGTLPKFGPAENKFTFHTPPDDRKGLWIAPSTDDANSKWAWDKALNLNRNGNHNLGGNLNLSGSFQSGLNDIPSIQFPTKNTKINARGIQFGGTNEGYEPNSAQISAGIHAADSLCMVGMGKNPGTRKIDMWAEGGAKLNGSLNVTGGIISKGRTITPSLFKIKPIHRGGSECMKAFDNDGRIGLAPCNNEPRQLWYWNGQQLRSSENDLCLTSLGGWDQRHYNAPVVLRTCEDGNGGQIWNWRDDHKLRNMGTSGVLRLPATAAHNASVDYNRQHNGGADIWDVGGCGGDCEMWFG